MSFGIPEPIILYWILSPNYQNKLLPIFKFFCGVWYKIWFSNHTFDKNDFGNLEQTLMSFLRALTCLLRHWVKDVSAIRNHQRSNICVERSIKTIQDPSCKTARLLNLRYIYFNQAGHIVRNSGRQDKCPVSGFSFCSLLNLLLIYNQYIEFITYVMLAKSDLLYNERKKRKT